MSHISLEKKIAQMLMIGFDGYEAGGNHYITEAIGTHNLGGVILYDLEEKDYKLKNIKSADQVEKLTSNLQGISDEPLFIGIDYEGGQVNRLKEEYGFPKTFSHQHLGKLNDRAATFEHSKEMANTLRSLGINLNFAPVVDLNINPGNPIIGKKERSFSENPDVVTSHAREFIKAHGEKGIITCIKHFPGHGSSTADSHMGFVDVSQTWDESELLPYKSLINENIVDCVMTAHVFNKNIDPHYPATLSNTHLDQQLRYKIGFDGVVFSDDLHMGAIRDNYTLELSLELAINAGVDILLISYNEEFKENLFMNLVKTISKLVDEGRISVDRIEQCYNRIKALKNNLIKAV